MEYGKTLKWLTVTIIQFMYYYALFELTCSSKRTLGCEQFNGQRKHILAGNISYITFFFSLPVWPFPWFGFNSNSTSPGKKYMFSICLKRNVSFVCLYEFIFVKEKYPYTSATLCIFNYSVVIFTVLLLQKFSCGNTDY